MTILGIMKDMKQGKPTMLLGKVYQTSLILKYHLFKISHDFKYYSKNNNCTTASTILPSL